AADADQAIRAITITGSGDGFTSGNDLADFLARPPADDETPVMRFLATIARAAKPIVAGVNGLAVGVGVTMLLHCDLVYATAAAAARRIAEESVQFRRRIQAPEAREAMAAFMEKRKPDFSRFA